MKQNDSYRIDWSDIRGEPHLDQGMLNGKHLSWNPDDGRFYVMIGEDVVATFTGDQKGWSRLLKWARTP